MRAKRPGAQSTWPFAASALDKKASDSFQEGCLTGTIVPVCGSSMKDYKYFNMTLYVIKI
jgi:hypothetical protein